ncbi:MAG: cobalamin-binding protein [Candidatus Dormibacteraeota bacterium]|nr:cobalamin-binding protein [Candidatus Dormibacteraeota bacterium]
MRVVSLLPSATEILFAVGAGDQIVAVTHECDHPAAARQLPAITSSAIDQHGMTCAEIDRHVKRALHEGSSLYHLNHDLLAELRPDLIVTQELCEVCAVSYREVCSAARVLSGTPDVLSLEPASIEDILVSMLTVGERTGCAPQARAAVVGLRDRLARVAGRRPPLRRRVVCIEWTDPLMVGGHWVPEMVELAGGVDVLGTAGVPSRWVDAETIAAAAPDVVVLMPCGYDLAGSTAIGEALLAAAPPWLGDAALVAVDGSAFFNRPGPRIIDGLELLVDVLHGDAQPDGGAARWLKLPPVRA